MGDFNTTVVLGAHNITYEEPEQQQIQSDQVIIHELWNATLARNDVSLIHLSTPALINGKFVFRRCKTATNFRIGQSYISMMCV